MHIGYVIERNKKFKTFPDRAIKFGFAQVLRLIRQKLFKNQFTVTMAENTDVVKKVEELKKKATELSSFISGFADAAFANKEIEELTDKLLALLRGSGKKTKTTISRIPAHEKYYGRMKDSVDKLEIAKLSSDVSSLFAQDVVPYEYVVDLNKIPEIKQIFSVLSTVMKNSKLVLRVNAWRIGHFVDKLFAVCDSVQL